MSDTSKEWNYQEPFKRINSPSYNPSRDPHPVDGRGYRCGCRSPEQGPTDTVLGLLIRDLMKAVPGWVPVEGNEEKEVQGTLSRSFQTWTDVPIFQWHRWYDWNFHVIPDEGFKYLRGMGNEPHGTRHVTPAGRRRVVMGETMECEWDCGAFGPGPGAMFNTDPGWDWAWPMTGQYVWLAGRWIYDCGHATSDERSGPNEGLMRSELHPCKAVATARWEAVKFEENDNLYVPGIQFMFFASRHGGYHEFSAINDRDYEFIVDLPPIYPADDVSWAIGHTPDFPHNTGVLRNPYLLKRFDAYPFAVEGVGAPDPLPVEPIVELLEPSGTDEHPKHQAKIKIPLTEIPNSEDLEAYGVIISLGWYDPTKSQARRIKRCRVTFNNIFKGLIDHDITPEEWVFKACVNNRWFHWLFDGVSNAETLDLGDRTVEFFLSEDDGIYISAHGAELDLVHDVFLENDNERTLRLNGRAADWQPDIVNGGLRRAHDICYEITGMMWWTFNDQNDPIGLIDPNHGDPGINPLNVIDNGERRFRLRAYFTEEVGESAELVESRGGRMDYWLEYAVDVQPQEIP